MEAWKTVAMERFSGGLEAIIAGAKGSNGSAFQLGDEIKFAEELTPPAFSEAVEAGSGVQASDIASLRRLRRGSGKVAACSL